MKKFYMATILCGVALLTLAFMSNTNSNLKVNFTVGDTQIASINSLSFGPEGILFIGDSKNAMIYALDTKDLQKNEKATEINFTDFDTKVAAALGTTKDNVLITDLAVNPLSKTVYLSVHLTDGTPVLLKLNGEKLENVPFKNVSHSKIALADPVAADAKDHRERPLRIWAIADMKYHNGTVMVTGLSNKEFSSTFRSIPFPFSAEQDHSTLEIWHAAHGRFETYAPIKAFDIINIDAKDYLMASYTCTPLVLFPLDELNGGKHIKGRTVAELGSGNSPLDMISFEKDGKPYFLMSNTNRGIMRFDYDEIAGFKESLTTPVTEFAKAEGVNYVSLPFVNVLQMDNLDADNVLLLRRTAEGDLVLSNRTKKWM